MQVSKALVVDDSRLSRMSLGRLLENHGITVDTANSAEEALRYLEGNRPDVVFMDYLMPDMNGYEVTKLITGNPHTKDIPVIICTSQDARKGRERALETGATGFITKPATEDTISTLLDQLSASGVAAAEPAELKPEPKPAPAHPAREDTAHADSAWRQQLEASLRAFVQQTATSTAKSAAEQAVLRLSPEIEKRAAHLATEAAQKVARAAVLEATGDLALAQPSMHSAAFSAEAIRNEVDAALDSRLARVLEQALDGRIHSLRTELETRLKGAAEAMARQTALDTASSLAGSLAQKAAAQTAQRLVDERLASLGSQFQHLTDERHKRRAGDLAHHEDVYAESAAGNVELQQQLANATGNLERASKMVKWSMLAAGGSVLGLIILLVVVLTR